MSAQPSKNYITRKGFLSLQAEFKRLKYEERPPVVDVVSWAAGNGDRSENGDYIYGKKKLREIDKRLRFLSKRIDAAEIIDPETLSFAHVVIGATVSVENDDGERKVFCIVGEDETDAARGKISWKSPIARALLRGKVGDYVTYHAPSGEKGLEIIAIDYKEIG